MREGEDIYRLLRLLQARNQVDSYPACLSQLLEVFGVWR